MIKQLWQGAKAVFSGGDVTEIAKGVGNFIDEQQFTEEEQSAANMKLLDFKIKLAQATSGQNLARRYCAIMFGLTYITAFLSCLAVRLFGEKLNMIKDIIGLVEAFNLGWIMLAIITYYFGKEMLGNKKPS